MRTITTRAVAAAATLAVLTGCAGADDAAWPRTEATPAVTATPGLGETDRDELELELGDHEHDHGPHEEVNGRWVLDPWPGQDSTSAAAVDEAWLRAVLTWQAGDQTWAQVSERAARLLAPDAYVEVLVAPVFDAAIRDVTARHGSSQVLEITDVTDPQAYAPQDGARVLAARVELTGAGGWSRPPLLVVAEVHTAGDLVVAVLMGEDSVTAEVGP